MFCTLGTPPWSPSRGKYCDNCNTFKNLRYSPVVRSPSTHDQRQLCHSVAKPHFIIVKAGEFRQGIAITRNGPVLNGTRNPVAFNLPKYEIRIEE